MSNSAEIVAADIGNTSATIAHMRGLEVLSQFDVSSHAPVQVVQESLRARTSVLLKLPLVVASVNPRGLEALETAWGNLGGDKACALGRDIVVPIDNRATPPEKVGQDRLVNALAARERSGGNAIVVDFGTAVSFDVVKDGAFVGGVLTPGIGLAMEALHQKTALLPLVRPDGIRPPVIGANTEDAINSGVYYGYIGLVNNILRELVKTYSSKPTVFATGGYGAYLAPEIEGIDVIAPSLTHEGIALSYVLTRRQ
ncbi:MAG: type III pantothenate kinase [Planctomycetes bacterium]|nr:type III pantothenate kinase [Planctomycetota bacterium]MCB9934643.1 type III pantothenate kinase [Planctomycetota bacterium]